MGKHYKKSLLLGVHEAERWHDLTISQLKQWGKKYHELIMNKPFCDIILVIVMTIENFKERM